MPSQRENSKQRRFSRLIKPPSVLKEPSFYNLSGIEEQKSIFDKVETPLRKVTESEASPCEQLVIKINKKGKLHKKSKARKQKFLEEFKLEIAENVSLYPELEFKPVDDSIDVEEVNNMSTKQKKIFKVQSSLFGRDLVKG